jgi:hypothetical protein
MKTEESQVPKCLAVCVKYIYFTGMTVFSCGSKYIWRFCNSFNHSFYSSFIVANPISDIAVQHIFMMDTAEFLAALFSVPPLILSVTQYCITSHVLKSSLHSIRINKFKPFFTFLILALIISVYNTVSLNSL